MIQGRWGPWLGLREHSSEANGPKEQIFGHRRHSLMSIGSSRVKISKVLRAFFYGAESDFVFLPFSIMIGPAMSALYQTNLPSIPLFRRGKVRDVYDLGSTLLMVATDRISAFDVIMTEPIPGKGEILTSLSTFWLSKTRHIIDNHVISTRIEDCPTEVQQYRDQLEGRFMLVRKTQPLPIECVVRGYLAGSGWVEYQRNSQVCGVTLPAGLIESSKLPQPIFTPATKAEEGHDENISFEQAAAIVGQQTAEFVRDVAIRLYQFAADYALQRGIILADTKFEFGKLEDGSIILIDEALTPDSSRYWLADHYEAGKAQMNFDKQVLRDWLLTQDWNKQAPAPTLPADIIAQTLAKYQEAARRLMSDSTSA